MLKDYLDREIYNLIIKSFNFEDVTEIRMRLNQNIVIVVKNKKYFLKNENKEYVKVNKLMIDNFVKRASENSLYAYNDSVINGYLTLPNGVRVGLSGNVVSNGNQIVTIKEFQALNIRIPHTVRNCSLPAFDFLVDKKIHNTLIISPPGAGKTTFLKDFIYQLGAHNIPKNILIVDERNEICSATNGTTAQDMGCFCDIYTNCSKEFAFNNGIRSMSPDVIITDELDLKKDLSCVQQAINSGVSVVATIHAENLNQLKRKTSFDKILDEKYFSRFVVLSNLEGPGTLLGIYDEKLNCVYCR